MRHVRYDILALFALLSGCSSSPGDSQNGKGGGPELGGALATGGAAAFGGHSNTRAGADAGGSTSGLGGLASSSTSSSLHTTSGGSETISSGGSPAGGHTNSAATTRATGGVTATGSTVQTGGGSSDGGAGTAVDSTAVGGTKPTSSTKATGGVNNTGGTRAVGGTSATTASTAFGGVTNTGGTKTSGGVSATGGSSSSGTCDTPPAPSELVGWASVDGGTTGGGNATPLVVSTLAELQNAVKGTSFAVVHVKGVLAPGVVTIGSNKTIVGLCGAEIHGHVGFNKSSNVIVRNVKIVGYAVGNCALDPNYSSSKGCSSGEDAITVQGQSTHLWFDHCDISDGTDGNLDITHASDYITVSWTKFHYTARTDNQGSDSTGASGHRYSNLIGGSDDNGSEDSGHLRVTWHHNWWADNVVERQPRVRFGQVHIFNNLWTSSTTNYCIGIGVSANVRTENNVFVGVKTPINTTSYSNSASAVRSTGNVYTNTGSTPTDVNEGSVFNPASSYSYAPDPTGSLEAAIHSGAGPK